MMNLLICKQSMRLETNLDAILSVDVNEFTTVPAVSCKSRIHSAIPNCDRSLWWKDKQHQLLSWSSSFIFAMRRDKQLNAHVD